MLSKKSIPSNSSRSIVFNLAAVTLQSRQLRAHGGWLIELKSLIPYIQIDSYNTTKYKQ